MPVYLAKTSEVKLVQTFDVAFCSWYMIRSIRSMTPQYRAHDSSKVYADFGWQSDATVCQSRC